MEVTKKAINKLQKYQSDLTKGIRHPRLGALTSFLEEVGELTKAIHEIEIYGNSSAEIKQNMKEEIADCLFSIFEIAGVYDIDLGEVYIEKLAMIESKINSWEIKYGETLKKARKKLD
ncbi:MAG TPA: MazG-like family protein [Patescibacteria group bacterium]|nr:MazG-like family protein [Patescibacteria group bacterium]